MNELKKKFIFAISYLINIEFVDNFIGIFIIFIIYYLMISSFDGLCNLFDLCRVKKLIFINIFGKVL